MKNKRDYIEKLVAISQLLEETQKQVELLFQEVMEEDD